MGKITLQGFLYDQKSSFLKGPAKAPPRIREAYRSDAGNFYAENGKFIHPDLFADAGDYEIESYFQIEKHTTENLKNGLPVISLGGDHSITYPIIKAFYSRYGPVDILHIDAHPDLYDQFNGDPHSHACPFARIMENGYAGSLTQLGIRTLSDHQRDQASRFKVDIHPMHNWKLTNLPAFENPIYLSLDIDALDPAFAPGVSHREPGGFGTRELLSVIQSIQAPIMGADIVEYNPSRDIQDMTAVLCAKLLKEIASAMF